MRNYIRTLRASLLVAGTAVGILIAAGFVWFLRAAWMLRTVGLPGPIDMSFGIP